MTESKSKGATRVSIPTKSASKAKSASTAAAKATGVASQTQPLKKLSASGKPPSATASEATVQANEKRHEQASGEAASRLIDQRIRDLGGWRGECLARVRALILNADPEMTEEWKWRGTPVWAHHGLVCTGETYTKVVKLTFARGAAITDPTGLFNSSLQGNTRRAIDITEGEQLDAKAFKALVKRAVALNGSTAQKKVKTATKKAGPIKAASGDAHGVVLLSGGNPQIAKADGDAPVQAYIAAMPGWKSDLGKRLDLLIARTVPRAHKAVRWNSPFYGIANQGWFLSFHVFTRYVKVTFFNGTALRPVPPGGTPRSQEARWIDICEGAFDEPQMEAWINQAAALPGWVP